MSHLDDAFYASAIKECEFAILHSNRIEDIYLVPAIAGTIDQLTPSKKLTPTDVSHNSNQRRREDRIRMLQEYCDDDNISSDLFSDYIDPNDEPPWIRTFRRGGGRSPFDRGGRGRGRFSRDRNGDRGYRPKNDKVFKGKCNSCGMTGHHSKNCHFLIKLQQALAYLEMEPKAPYKKRNNFKGKNTYQQNRDYVRSLQDAGFIPYDGADADNFLMW